MVIDCCVIILTCLFPPIGVFLVCGIGAELVINICLTILGFLPGHIHAFYLLVQHAGKPQPYQAVPTNRTHVPQNGQYRQYDVYQPKQAEPVPQQGNNALVKDYKNQAQYGETSYNNNNPTYPQQQPQPQPHYKSTDGNPPPSYKS